MSLTSGNALSWFILTKIAIEIIYYTNRQIGYLSAQEVLKSRIVLQMTAMNGVKMIWQDNDPRRVVLVAP